MSEYQFFTHETLFYMQGWWHSPHTRHSFTCKDGGTLHTRDTLLHARMVWWHSPHTRHSYMQGWWHSPHTRHSFTYKDGGTLHTRYTLLHARMVALSTHETLVCVLNWISLAQPVDIPLFIGEWSYAQMRNYSRSIFFATIFLSCPSFR
jgi:hypothetical protein